MATSMSALQVALRDELRDLEVFQRVCPITVGLDAASKLPYPHVSTEEYLDGTLVLHATIESVLPASATTVERAIALGAAMVLALEARLRSVSAV